MTENVLFFLECSIFPMVCYIYFFHSITPYKSATYLNVYLYYNMYIYTNVKMFYFSSIRIIYKIID